jgi:hypothetical protein
MKFVTHTRVSQRKNVKLMEGISFYFERNANTNVIGSAVTKNAQSARSRVVVKMSYEEGFLGLGGCSLL